MPTFKVTPYLGVGADADDVQNGKALGGVKLNVTDDDSDVTLKINAQAGTAAGKVSDVSYEGAVFDLEKKGAFKFSLSVPSGGSANLAMTLEHAAKVCGTDVALKYTATAGQDNGVISGKFKATDDVDATLVYDLDRFSGLDVNKLSCVVKYNVDDDTHVSASYHARNKKSVVRASKKVDDSNTVEAAAFLTLDGGFAFNSAEATLTNAMSDGDLQVRARVDGSNKVSLAVNKEWNLDV